MCALAGGLRARSAVTHCDRGIAIIRYRVQRPGDHGTRHCSPATIKLVNLHLPALAA